MEQEQTKVSKFLAGVLPTVKVQPVYNRQTVTETAAIVFITVVLCLLAYFSIKKIL